MLDNRLDPIIQPTPSKIWCLLFFYACAVAAAVQLVVLPLIFPSLHAGHGLLAGGDWLSFHELAERLAQRIRTEGWPVWELRPGGQAPSGIAAAIYALTVPEPWTFIPINAALYATSGLALLNLIRVLAPDFRDAGWAVLPFLLYPSGMIWYTQLHKDGFFIAGSLLFLSGWVLLSRRATWGEGRWLPIQAALSVIIGASLIWLVRPYAVQMLQAFGIIMALVVAFTIGSWSWRKTISPTQTAYASVLIIALMFSLTALKDTEGAIKIPLPETVNRPAENPGTAAKDTQRAIQVPAPASVNRPAEKPVEKDAWRNSGWLPDFIESKIYALVVTRDGFRSEHPKAPSNLDAEVSFKSVGEIVAYLPRLLQISLLAPFPNQWLESGSLEGNTLMRRISGLETLGVYVSLALLPVGLWRWWRRPELWIILIMSLGMTMTYALVSPNIGTLYRFRYGFIMTLMALGIAGFSSTSRSKPS